MQEQTGRHSIRLPCQKNDAKSTRYIVLLKFHSYKEILDKCEKKIGYHSYPKYSYIQPSLYQHSIQRQNTLY